MQGMQVPNRAHFSNLTLSVKFGHKSSDQRRLGLRSKSYSNKISSTFKKYDDPYLQI